MTSVLALDPGYGNIKVCVDGHVACLQSAIARPQAVGMAVCMDCGAAMIHHKSATR
jgi:hypothetical protein